MKNCTDSKDTYVGLVYLPPEGSKYAHAEMWDEFQFEFSRIKSLSDNVIIMGDFNSRTSTHSDIVYSDDFLCNQVGIDDELLEELNYVKLLIDAQIISYDRCNEDKVLNNYGRKLIDFCKSNNVVILNGRFGEDRMVGKVTCKDVRITSYHTLNVTDLHQEPTYTVYQKEMKIYFTFADVDHRKKLKMSEQSSHIQSTDSSGVGSMSKHSNGNIEMSDSDHTAMYGSMPDVSSDGLHRQSDTSDETSHTFPEQHGNREEKSYESLPQFNPTMTSTPVKVRDPPSMSTSGRDDSSDNLQENKSVETSNVINSLFTENMKDMKEDKAEESDYMADKSEQSESTQETLKLTVLNQEGSDDVMTFKEGVEAHSASGHSSIDKSVEDAHKLMTDTESSGSALNTNILSRECFRQYSETSSSSEDDEFAYLRHPEQEKTNDQTVERNNENVEGSRREEVRIDDVSVPTTGSGSERGGGLEEQRTSGKIGEGQDEKLSGMEDKSQESIEEVMRNEDLSIQDINTGGSVATSEDSEDILPGKEGILAHAASGHSSIDKSHEDLHQLMTDSESSGSVNAKVLSCECFRPYSPTSSSCSSLDEELQHQIEEEEKGGGDLMAQQESMNEMKLGNLFSVSDMVVKPISPVTSETERRPSEDTHEKITAAADMESRDIAAEMSESQRSEETPDISRSENADERSISLQSVEESGQQQGFSDQSYTSTEDHLSSGTSHEDNRSNMEDLGPYGVIDHSSRTPVSFRDSIQDVVPSSYLKQKLKKRASIEMRKIQAEDVKLSDIYRPPKVESGYFRRRSLPLPEHRSYEMSDVHNEKPTYSSLPDVKVRQKTQEEQKENRSEDEAIADNSQKKTPNIPEREDSVHQESMTAFNTEVSRPVRILSREGYGEADFTSAIDLLEHLRVLSDTECDLDHSQAKAKGQHVDAAFLQKRKIEEDRHSSEMPPSKQLKSNKDTQPSNKDHSIIETDSEKPSSNNLSGITPSELLQKRDDRERTEEAGKSPGYGEFAYTTPSALMMRKESSKRVDLEGATPSRLLQRRVDRERTVEAGQSPGYGEFAYTTPSALMMRKESSKRVDLEGNTPSRLLQRRVERERTVEVGKSPGYGVLSYTSPSQLLKKQLQNKQHDAGTKYASREAVSLEGRTPSALLQRRDDRLRGEESAASPGYGAFSYTSPSQMMAKHPQEENRDTRHASSSHMVPNTKLDDESHDLGYSSFDTEQDSKHQTSESSGGMRTQSNIGDYFHQLSQILHSMSLQMPSSFSDPELRRQMESIQQGISQYSNLSAQQRGANSTNRHIGNDYSQGTNGIGAKSSGSLPGTWFFAQPTSLIRAVCEKAENKVRGNKTAGRKEIVDEPVQDQESSWSMMQNPSFLCMSDDENEEEVTSNGVGGWRYDTSTANGRGRDHTVSRQERLSDSPYPTDARQMSFNEMIWDMYCHNPEIAKEMTSSLEVNMSDGTDQGDEPIQTAHEGQINAKKRQLPNAGTRSVTPDSRSWIMAKEVMESQNRKLQIENSKLELENKLLKEKYNKATAKISSLEEQLCQVQEELEAVNNNMAKELSEAQRRHQTEFTSDLEQFQNKILSLSHQNETLKAEVLSLEKQLDSAEKMSDFAKHATEKSKTVEAFKMEATSLKDEVSRVKSLLQQSERHLQDEENRNRELGQQVLKLTEMKNMLQQQLDIGSGGGVSDKQIKSLEKRLRITEERLHQERADRANNLSEVEDKLLTENARLKGVEKELNRQLQRERDKNHNLEQKVRDVREENEKLRLALPFDESTLTLEKGGYDIPYGLHSSQRSESLKPPEFKFVMSQVEEQSGLKVGQEQDVICHLWNTRESTYRQLRHWESILQDLNLRDNNITEGLKSLRDIKSQYETKLHQAEEKMQDAKSEKTTAEATYKEQLGELVKERHEAFARLKTAEDLLEAVRGENEILKKNMSGIPQQSHGQPTKQSQLETLSIELRNLENQMQQLQRSNQLLESEVTTMKVQLAAKDKALEEAASQLDIANSRLDNSEALDRKQNKIDKLTTELSSLQSDIQYATDKANKLSEEKKTLEAELERSKLELTTAKAREKESKAGGQADNKLLQSLKEEVEDSDRRSGHLSKELTSMETQIQQCKHELYTTQSHCEHLQAQVESLQRQLDQRGHILDTVSAAEREHVAQFKILKDTLDSVSLELKNKQSQNKTVTMELRREKDKVNKLLKDKGEWRENKIGPFSSGIGETQNEIKIRELTEEKEKLMEQLCEANQEIEQHVRDCTSMEKDLKQLHQELAAEKSRVLTMSTEKGELEQHLEEIAEEHDAVIQEKNQVEDDLVRLESKLQEILQTLEIESQPLLHGSSDPTQIASELESLKLINEARCKEMETLKDKISRQSMEMNFLQRRVELLHSENQSNREDISRLTGELANKIKESVSIRDINQFLVGEKSRLESDIGSFQQEMVWEREHVQKESAQLTQTIQKLESDSHHSSQRDKDELSSLTHKLDLLQQEQELLLNNLNTEKQTTESLRSELHDQQSECDRLRQQTNTLTMDLESCRVQLTAAKESVDNLKQDKGAIYQEYDSMCRRLSEKDQKIQELQEKNEVMVREMQQEFSQQQSTLEKEKTSTERQLDKAKEQITVLNEEIKQKDLQLSTFGKTLAELDDVTKQKNELALHVSRAEKTSGDSKIVVDGQRDEIMSLQETISRMQEIQSKIQVEKSKLEEEFRESESAHASQVQELNQTISTLRSHSEGEKIYLKDNLSQSQNRLQSIESSLASAIESRDKLQVSNRSLERSLEDTKGELQDKITLLKVAEQRAETLQTQLNESRKDRFLTEEKLNTIQYEHSKAEKELRTEKEKTKQYQEKVQEQEAVSYSNEMTAKSKQEQVDILQGEITKLKQIIDNQKQQLGGRLKKSTVEFKQQIELMETERGQIVQQNQQLQLDLERARDQIQLKNKENLKLQEEMLVFEEQIREKTQKLKHAEDTLKAEEDLQSRLSSKYQAQEDELKQLRTFLTKKAEESGDAEKVMWQEMNKVIQEMSRQMASHFDTQKSPEKIVDKEQVSKVVKKYKRQISDLETDLNTERALHQITRTSLQALEEDCQRLRKQFHAMKRRDHATDKKYKNRMEAINEIIARSQTQAQAMLAAGGQFEETLRSLTTPINTPRGIDYGGRVSPDSSVASDFSFNSIGPSVIPPYNPSSPRKQ
ncbi:hypothetical protein FSP39_022200 [Pinctada imbricata]|uniref:Uncharacterized protein n=1 Tax=Pinctada imbricata TaxID=66713 RepID=A0AA89BY43_PINIB|nr:hypothetical protein FSP39_022200 [Pinctada imbricata]